MGGVRELYRVERGEESGGRVEISLVRVGERVVSGRMRRRTEVVRREVILHRAFRPVVELAAMEAYAGKLSSIARYANEGTFGCFVVSQPVGGNVEICLYDRWFDGTTVRTHELARRAFDAEDESALVAGAEFLADLQAWAERHNDEREELYQQASSDAELQRSRTAERASAATELAQILAAAGKGS